VAGRFGSTEKSSDVIENRTGGLQACSIVPQLQPHKLPKYGCVHDAGGCNGVAQALVKQFHCM
jgi:hypothetical protein